MVALPDTDKLRVVPAQIGFRRREAKLGDGYRRTAQEGLNNADEVFSVFWILLSAADADTIKDLLKATGGTETVTWTPPGESSSRNWTVENIDHNYNDPINKIVSCSLREKFSP